VLDSLEGDSISGKVLSLTGSREEDENTQHNERTGGSPWWGKNGLQSQMKKEKKKTQTQTMKTWRTMATQKKEKENENEKNEIESQRLGLKGRRRKKRVMEEELKSQQ